MHPCYTLFCMWPNFLNLVTNLIFLPGGPEDVFPLKTNSFNLFVTCFFFFFKFLLVFRKACILLLLSFNKTLLGSFKMTLNLFFPTQHFTIWFIILKCYLLTPHINNRAGNCLFYFTSLLPLLPFFSCSLSSLSLSTMLTYYPSAHMPTLVSVFVLQLND